MDTPREPALKRRRQLAGYDIPRSLIRTTDTEVAP